MANVTVQDLKNLLSNSNPSFYSILDIKDIKDKTDIEQFIDDLDDSKNNSGQITQENQTKIDALYSFAEKVYAMKNCFDNKIDDAIYNKEIATMKQYFPSLGVKDFFNDIIDRSNKEYNNLFESKYNEYLETIYDKLGISDTEKVNFVNLDADVSISEKLEIIGKLAKVIGFIEEHQKNVANSKSINNNITDIKNSLLNIPTGQKIIDHFNDVYNKIEQNLTDDLLQKNYDLSKLNGITNFDDITLTTQGGEIGDNIYPTGLDNRNHPMRYLLKDFEKRRAGNSSNWGADQKYELLIEQDDDGYPTMFDNKQYKMGKGASLDFRDDDIYLNHLTGSLDHNGTKINIGHDKGKNVSPLAFQASINATVESMQENFGKYSNNPNNYKFNLKLNSLSPATCQVMFKELAKYAEAQANPKASTATEYNKRFDHFKDIFINGVKLDRDLFTNPAKYMNNNNFDEDIFVDEVWKRIENTLNQKQNNQLTDEMSKLLAFAKQR